MMMRDDLADIEPGDWAFHFDTGRPCLNFTSTLAERGMRSFDRWREPADLARWFSEAGFDAPTHVGPNELQTARELREAIYRLVTAAHGGRKPKPADVELINQWSANPVAVPQLYSLLEQWLN